ncbi:DJ-1/PfpI family protein [Phenylobacterium sp.]|jgi:putative intracellular protease/amidase|uniref:DJ-1/PfpI family protein n=1 Tax=Phenylobacterium sp. TaxID=1871053 RepID=UPI002F92AFA4
MMTRRTLITAAAGLAAAGPSAAQAPQADIRTLATKAGLRPGGVEQIAMLLYPGMTALDFVGPYHFLASMPGAKVHLVTNQADLRPVPSDLGMAIQPTTLMKDCPDQLTVLFTPGGTAGTVAAARDAATVAFMRDRAARARYVTSVCTGSLILGAAGVLKGRRATSHWAAVPLLEKFGAIPVRERVVRDGNVITGAGVSAGLDFGSGLVAEIQGRPAAEAAVLLAEYDPQPPIRGGSLRTARPEIAEFLKAALSPFTAEAAALRVL